MIRFETQPARPGMPHSEEEMLKAGEPYPEVETVVEPLEQHDPEFIGKAKDRRQVDRKIKVLQREKVVDWGSRQVSYVPEAVDNSTAFVKKNVLDKAFPGMVEAAQGVYEKLRDSIPVKFVEDTGIGMRMRLFMFNNGPSAGLEPKIAKGKSRVKYLKQRQQQDAYEYERVSKNFKGQDVGIEKAKKEKEAYWQDRIDREIKRVETIKAKLKAKEFAMEKLQDGLNNRIDNKIKKIENAVNYTDNKERQKELMEAIKSVEADLDKSKKVFKEFQDIQAQLLDNEAGIFSSKIKSEDRIFSQKGIETDEKNLSAGEKTAAENARSVIKSKLEDGKISLKNIAKENGYKLEQFGKEIKILENNLAKLRKAKDKIDAVCIKTEHRVATWELERMRLGVNKEDNKQIGKGEHVNIKLSREETDKLISGIDSARVELRTQSSNPEHWFGKDAMEKSKNDGIDAGLNEEVVAKGLIRMKEMARQTVFDMDKVMPAMAIEKTDPEDQRALDFMKKRSDELKTEALDIGRSAKAKEKEGEDLKQANQKPSQAIRDKYDALFKEADELRSKEADLLKQKAEFDGKIKTLEKKIADDSARILSQNAKNQEYIRDREYIQKEIIDKLTLNIPEDLGSKQRSWTEFKQILFKVFPDLEQYETNFTNKDVPPFNPDIPEGDTPDVVDKELEDALRDIDENDPSKLLELVDQKDLSGESLKFVLDRINDQIKNEPDALSAIKLLSKFGESLNNSVSSGKIDLPLASQLFSESVSSIESNIMGENSNTKSQRLANFALVCAKHGEGLIDQEKIYTIFENAIEIAKDASGTNLPEDITEETDVSSTALGTDPSLEAQSFDGLKKNMTFFKNLKYIQDKMMKAGLESPGGYTKKNIELRRDAFVQKAESGDPASFTRLALYAAELATNGQYDYAVEISEVATKITDNDPHKLIELATFISSGENKDMGPIALGIFEKAYNLAEADGSEKLKFDIIEGVMSSDNLYTEGFDSNIEQKFDKIFEKNKDDFMMTWSMYESLKQVKDSSTSSAKALATKMIEKVLLRTEVLAKTGPKENYVSDQDRVAVAMRQEGMEMDARRIEIQLETEKLKAENEANAKAQAESEAKNAAGDQEGEQIFEDNDFNFINDVEAPDADSEFGDGMLPLRQQGYGGGMAQNTLEGNAIGTEGNAGRPKKKGWLSSLFSGLLGIFGGNKK